MILLTETVLADKSWAQSYGPNVASSLLELFIGAGFLQWIVERQRKPIVEYAHRRAQGLLRGLVDLMNEVIDAAPTRGAKPSSFADLRARWLESIEALDFGVASRPRVATWRSPLERITSAAKDVRRDHVEAADIIGQYCDPQLVVAFEELIHGPQTKPVWSELLEDRPPDPSVGWLFNTQQADDFAAEVERCLVSFRDSTGRRPLEDW